MSTHFDNHAKDWDKEKRRTSNALKIANAIRKQIPFTSHDKILDFGAGTGLLSWEFAPLVDYILGVDTSKEMIKTFLAKDWQCKVDGATIDLSKQLPNDKFNGIMSSMTMHHVEFVEDYLKAFYKLLKKEGFIAIADLVSEDGDFHSSGKEIHHLGFEPENMKLMLIQAGFYDVSYKIVNTIEKEVASGEVKQFPIFLIIGKKSG